ncbi:unnamed protein product [Caretta caretta]
MKSFLLIQHKTKKNNKKTEVWKQDTKVMKMNIPCAAGFVHSVVIAILISYLIPNPFTLINKMTGFPFAGFFISSLDL